MFDFNKPSIEIAEMADNKKYGRFVVEPLERGYGTTLGNSPRGLSRVEAGHPGVPRLVQVTSGGFSWWL